MCILRSHYTGITLINNNNNLSMFLKLSDSPFRSCITHTNNKRMCEVFWYYIVVLNCFMFFCIIIFSLIKKLPGSLSLVMQRNHRSQKVQHCSYLLWFSDV